MSKDNGSVKKKLTDAQREKLKERIPKKFGIYLDETKEYEAYYIKFRKKTFRGYDTLEDAINARTELKEKDKAGKPIDPNKQTLSEYFEWWSRVKRAKLNTKKSYATTLAHLNKYPIGKVPVVKLTTLHFEEHIYHLLEKGMKMSSVRTTVIKNVKAALNYGVKHQILTENVLSLLEIDFDNHDEEDEVDNFDPVSDFTPDDAYKFLEFVMGKKYRNLAVLYFYSGARRAEILGLREIDVDFEKDTVSFNWSIVSGEKGSQAMIQKSLKTKASKRTITLDKPAMRALKTQLRKKYEYRIAAGSSFVDQGLIFCMPDGSPIAPNKITDWFSYQFEKFGKPEMTLHYIRHWVATQLLAAGADPVTVQKRLGHSSLLMTMKYYAHLQREKDGVSAALLGKVIESRTIV